MHGLNKFNNTHYMSLTIQSLDKYNKKTLDKSFHTLIRRV